MSAHFLLHESPCNTEVCPEYYYIIGMSSFQGVLFFLNMQDLVKTLAIEKKEDEV